MTSADFFPAGVALDCAFVMPFLNLGTLTAGLAGRCVEFFPTYSRVHLGAGLDPQPCHRMHLLHLDKGRQPGHQEYTFCLPGKLGRQPIAILASSTALFRAENLSPVCLPLTSSLNRLNKARPAGVPLHTVVQFFDG